MILSFLNLAGCPPYPRAQKQEQFGRKQESKWATTLKNVDRNSSKVNEFVGCHPQSVLSEPHQYGHIPRRRHIPGAGIKPAPQRDYSAPVYLEKSEDFILPAEGTYYKKHYDSQFVETPRSLSESRRTRGWTSVMEKTTVTYARHVSMERQVDGRRQKFVEDIVVHNYGPRPNGRNLNQCLAVNPPCFQFIMQLRLEPMYILLRFHTFLLMQLQLVFIDPHHPGTRIWLIDMKVTEADHKTARGPQVRRISMSFMAFSISFRFPGNTRQMDANVCNVSV